MTTAGRAATSLVNHSLMESVADTTAHRDRDSLNGAVAQMLRDFLDAESVTAHRLVEHQGVMRILPSVVARRGTCEMLGAPPDDPSVLRALGNSSRWNDCVRQRRPVRYRESSEAGKFEFSAFPIESARVVLGLLVIKSVKALQPRELHLVCSILRILKNHMELLDYGERDTLTRMLNRKTFETRFTKIRERLRSADALRTPDESSWLGLVDIDHFKSINDSHGHLFGDEVLLLISQLMRECFRGCDQLFRFGGEEFVIVLDRATAAGAHIAFERLRTTIDNFQFPQVGRVAISLGYSPIRLDDGPTTCVERADAALYYAKRHGRNRICHFEALTQSGDLVAKCAGADADAELF